LRYVRFTPESGHWLREFGCPLCAKSGHRRETSLSEFSVIEKTLRYRFWQLVDRTHEATVAILRGKRMEEHPL
jgi:hypothetical protein